MLCIIRAGVSSGLGVVLGWDCVMLCIIRAGVSSGPGVVLANCHTLLFMVDLIKAALCGANFSFNGS